MMSNLDCLWVNLKHTALANLTILHNENDIFAYQAFKTILGNPMK